MAYHLTTHCEQPFNENSDSTDAEKIKTHNNEDAHLVTIYSEYPHEKTKGRANGCSISFVILM